jgi:Zn-dependent peptidase ImmA (M78 family)/O-acetyl-ADP-ribose deacetylase (regulator of RNase III)
LTTINWTNPSVKALAGDADPIREISDRTRKVVLDAIDDGWEGPPFDPMWLAKHLGISLMPRDDILDSRILSKGSGQRVLEYNPNQPHSRIRFSLAHEIAHTMFPDFSHTIKHRNGPSARPDDWQVELLCNISAAEILMPAGPFDLSQVHIAIDDALELRKRFDVSVEALLLRIVKTTKEPITVFVAARQSDDKDARYRIDYCLKAVSATLRLPLGLLLPKNTMLAQCTAVGYTAKGREGWPGGLPDLDIECVGIPSYPGSVYPRVIGILREKGRAEHIPGIRYLIGDASQPRGNGNRIIAHIVNDTPAKWGKGFAFAIADKMPKAYEDFVNWIDSDKSNLHLGNSKISSADGGVSVFHMIAQHGYGPSPKPRIRYSALKDCLADLAKAALELHATVHMPRIGTGYSQGNWSVIKELIDESLIRQGIDVTVYDLPGRESRPSQDMHEFLDSIR